MKPTDSFEELIDEQLTRTCSFLTPDGLAKLRNSFVIVVGLGGVGSHCTASLVRSGVGYIRVIDFDQVTLSSLNRHAVATLADVGTPKVQCIKRRLEAAVPWTHWDTVNEIWKESAADRLLAPFGGIEGRKPDYVVDAIDNIDSKVALLKCCHDRGIRVISSMGAGCKSDPTRVMVGDISATTEDPLSKSTRRRLRLLGVSEGINAVYSTEKPGPGKAKLLPLSEEEFGKGSVGDLSVLPDFRVRILPVIGTMPAVFGYVAANFIIMEISQYPHETPTGKARDKFYDTVYAELLATESRLVRAQGGDTIGLRLRMSKEDIAFVIDEVFRGKSVISSVSSRLALVRWRAPAGGFKADTSVEGQKMTSVHLEELVCMTKEEAAVHEKQVLLGQQEPEAVYESKVLDLVTSRFREEQEMMVYR